MVCIEKRPYTLYGRLATLHFRYLTCLLDRGHIILGWFFYVKLVTYQINECQQRQYEHSKSHKVFKIEMFHRHHLHPM